jgi:hypothetical protein
MNCRYIIGLITRSRYLRPLQRGADGLLDEHVAVAWYEGVPV